jgi:hypothetical protein
VGNTIVMKACFADGSRQVVTEYASSTDMTIYRADGTPCLRILDDSGSGTLEDPSGQVVYAKLTSSGYSCGGVTSPNLSCADGSAHAHLPSLGVCQQVKGPCP